MLSRAIPSSKETLPVIGLGSWIQFDIDAHSPERENLEQVLDIMHRHDATLLDSSPMYGRAESMIGELTSKTKFADKFFYATKVWTTGREAGISQMQDSFRKMKRDVMDLMQIHNLTDWKTHLLTLQQWKTEGKIRYTGITHYQEAAHAQLETIISKEKIDFVQFNYSIATRAAEKSLLRTAMDKEVAVIINEPLEKGKLFESVRGKALPAWSSDYDIDSWAQFFLKYVISHHAVTCVIPGTSDPDHLADNIKAGKGTMPDEKGRQKMAAFFDGL